MGFAVLQCEKCSQESLLFRGAHNERVFKNHSNPDIDRSRSHQNLVLADYEGVNLYQEFKKRVDQVQANQTRKIRKDCPWAMEYIISFSPEDKQRLSPKEQEQYFKDAVDFFKKYHGAENVVSAIVHFDETTPHMHMLVLPMHENKLNSKFFMARNQLKSLHTEFHKKVGKKYGLMRGKEQKEGEPKKVHLTVEEYKAKQEQLKREKHLPDEIALPDVEKKFLISESAEEYKQKVEVLLRNDLETMKTVKTLYEAQPQIVEQLSKELEINKQALNEQSEKVWKLEKENRGLKEVINSKDQELEKTKKLLEEKTEEATKMTNFYSWAREWMMMNKVFDAFRNWVMAVKLGKNKEKQKPKSNDMER